MTTAWVGPPRIALAGGGELAEALLKLLEEQGALGSVLAVADPDETAPAMLLARSRGLATAADFRELFSLPGLEAIVETTGEDAVLEELLRTRPRHLLVVGHVRAKLIAEGALPLSEAVWAATPSPILSLFARQVLDAIGDGLAIVNRDYQVVEANETIRRLTGGDLQKCWLGFERPCPECRVREAFETGQPQEMVTLACDGRWVELRTYPLKDERGETTLVIEHVRDVSLRRQAEEALKESERRFRQLAENIDEVFWFASLEPDQMLYVSPAFERVFGLAPQAIYENPRAMPELVHPEDRQRVIDSFAAWRRGGSPKGYAIEYRIIRPDGSVRWLRDRVTGILDEQGGLWGASGLAEDITERKRAEESLEESEARYRALVDNAQVGVFRCRLSGEIDYLNRAAAAMAGYDRPEEIYELKTGQFHADLEDRERVLTELKAQGRISGREVKMRNRRGEVRTLLASACLRGDIIDGTLTDITEQKRAAERLAASEERYRLLVENSPDCIKTLDPQGRFLSMNRAGLQAMGRTLEETLGRYYADDFLPSGQPAVRQAVGRAAAGERVTFEGRDVRGRVWLVTLVPLRDGQGRVERLLGVSRDVTRTRQTEQAVRRSEERYRLLLENSPDCIKTLDAEGRFLSVNKAGLQMMGRTLEETLGRLYLNDFHPADQPAIRRGLAKALEGETTSLEARSHPAAPRQINWLVTFVPPNVQGEVLVVARDVTGLKRAEETMRRANEELARLSRLKDEFLSMASHELKTPVTSIKLFCELALRQPQKVAARLPEVLATINRQADHLVSLVNDLLDVSRLDLGRVRLELEPCDVEELLDEVCRLSLELYPSHPLRCQPPPEPVLVRADRSRLIQVLQNLIDNAAKYSAEGSPIEVSVAVANERVTLAVRDLGPGIAPEDLPHIFERFFKSPTQQALVPGLGLGLYISRELIKRHGGRLWAESTPGQGSTFYIELPLLPARPPV